MFELIYGFAVIGFGLFMACGTIFLAGYLCLEILKAAVRYAKG